MIKQAIDQPRTEAQEHPKAGKQKDGKEFESQLAVAALLAPHAQKQVLQPQAPEAGTGKVQAEGTGPQQSSALNLKAANPTNGRDSAVAMNALAGLNQPWKASEWVFEGEGMPQDPAAKAGAHATASTASSPATSGQPAADARLAKSEATAPGTPGTRGDADGALASKLELLAAALAAGQHGQADAGAGAQAMAGMQAQLPLQQQPQTGAGAHAAHGLGAAASDAALEAQLASLGGAVQGFGPQQGAGVGIPGAPGANGRVLVPGAKGRVAPGSAQAGLSGDEFLSALGAAKGGVSQGTRFGQQSQFEGEMSDEGKSGGMAGGKASLRVIHGGAKDGKAGFESELTASQSPANLGAMATGTHGSQHASALGGAGRPAEVTGHVVQGANAENRLSSEALAGISGSIRSFSANGGGEIRIRLRPENLGELHVRVVTDGRNVGLHIQASDEKARKILEESLSHLKDSMATQNLSLGAVDLTVGRSHSSGFGDSLGNQQPQGQGQWSGDLLGGQSGQSHQREGRGAWAGNGDGNAPFGARVARPAALGGTAQAFGPARGASAPASGRLDVTA